MAKLEQRRYKNTILNNEQRRHTWKKQQVWRRLSVIYDGNTLTKQW